MQKHKKNTSLFYTLAFLLFLGGVSWLIYSGLTSSSVYFLNVSEALAASPEKVQSIRLFGTVAERDLKRDPNSLHLSFLLEDKDNATVTIAVSYQGMIPDAFKAGAEVIVEGGMNADKSFQAKTLMTKCPSKYQKENRRNL
ncbi:MAG: cytochrome c maturation protein CcmE [Desulfovibrio sp.]|nr:cytochrome c maturation protein CcmE [Desulfovibrio sp.]